MTPGKLDNVPINLIPLSHCNTGTDNTLILDIGQLLENSHGVYERICYLCLLKTD